MFTANQTLWSLARSGEIYCLFFHIIIVLLYHNNNPSIAMMQASTPHIYSTEGTFQSNVSFILWTTSLRSLGQSFIGSCHRSMKLSSLPFIFAPSFSYKKHKLVPKSLCYNQAAVFLRIQSYTFPCEGNKEAALIPVSLRFLLQVSWVLKVQHVRRGLMLKSHSVAVLAFMTPWVNLASIIQSVYSSGTSHIPSNIISVCKMLCRDAHTQTHTCTHTHAHKLT